MSRNEKSRKGDVKQFYLWSENVSDAHSEPEDMGFKLAQVKAAQVNWQKSTQVE